MSTLAREYMSVGQESIYTGSFSFSTRWIRVRFERFLSLLQEFHAAATQRKALSQLTDDQLKDIGISRVDAMQEAGKPFWK